MTTFERFEAGWNRAEECLVSKPDRWFPFLFWHSKAYSFGYFASVDFFRDYENVPTELAHEEMCRQYILHIFEDFTYKPWFPTKGLKKYKKGPVGGYST